MYSKKVSRLEAMKEIEEEIIEQYNILIKKYQKFPNPFKIYSFIPSENLNKIKI